MAKKAKSVSASLNLSLLAEIVAATVAGGFVYVTQTDAVPLRDHNPPLIIVNGGLLDPNDNTKAAAKATPEGIAMVNGTRTTEASTFPYAVIANAVLPPSKRGNKGGGAPTQYPFDKMEIGQSFFVPVSDKHPDPVKTLGSTVSSANQRFSEPTGETKSVVRTKRGDGNKAVNDAAGNKVKETVTVPVKRQIRKFSIRAVEAGKKYGDWTAPSDGALIARVAVA